MRRAVIVGALLAAFVAGVASPTGIVEKTEVTMEEAIGREITLRGVVATYGSEPITYLGLLTTGAPAQDGLPAPAEELLVADETVFELVGELVAELDRWQGSSVELTGTLIRESAGPGMHAAIEVRSFSLPQR